MTVIMGRVLTRFGWMMCPVQEKKIQCSTVHMQSLASTIATIRKT